MTRLKALELFGFKSFADRTRFEFPEGITVVVGPNGSGKSNVVDAIKWVLGEQSVRSLRGRDMTDVIFAGSASRKPLNAAETSLIFDNSARQLLIDTDDVQITRRVYRSGENEYLVNGAVSRLRDIRELFSGTGAATEAYSVIEQGRVDALLVASGRDRRAVFEEAAGITRFRARRAEALRRLERAEQNRQRLADIVGEVSTRLETVKHQAARARRWRQMTERLRLLRVTAATADLAAADAAVRDVDMQLADLAARLTAAEAESAAAAMRAASFEERHQQLEPQLAAMHGRYADDRRASAAAEATVALLRQRRHDLDADIARIGDELRTFVHRQRSAARVLEEALAQVEASADEHDRIEAQLAARDQAAAGSHESLTTLRERLAQQSARVADLERTLRRVESEAQRASMRADEGRRIADGHRGAVAAAHEHLARLVEAAAGRDGAIASLERRFHDTVHEVERSDSMLREHATLVEAAWHDLAGWRAKLEANRERRVLLEEIVGRHEGLSEAARTLLGNDVAASIPGLHGVVGELIDAPLEWAPLVDVVLGARAQGLVVDSIGDVVQWFRLWMETPAAQAVLATGGRITFLPVHAPADAAQPDTDLTGHPGVIGRLDRLVMAEDTGAMPDGLVHRLLTRVWVVDRLDHARALVHEAPPGTLVVTRGGQCLSGDGTFEIGAPASAHGLVARRSELRSLCDRDAELSGTVATAEARIRTLQADIAELQEASRRLQAKRQHDAEALASSRAEAARLGRDCDAARNAIAAAEQATLEAERQAAALAQARDQAEALVERHRHDLAIAEREATATSSTLGELDRDRGEVLAEINRLRVARASCSERLTAARQAAEARRGERDAATRDVTAVRDRLAATERRRDEFELELLDAGGAFAEAMLAAEQSATLLAELTASRDAVASDRQSATTIAEQSRAAAAAVGETIHARELAAGEARHHRSRILERIRDEYDIDLEAELRAGTASTTPADGETIPADRAELDTEIETLRRKLGSMSTVNLEALAEADELAQRLATLESQLADVTNAKQSIEQLISRIDEESRRLLGETIETVRGYFRELFERVFGGGEADVVLEPDVDLLETSVEIVARPPGKEPRSISLLSGGEKTMTCVALLLAIFRSRPSPFCVLDEVDAALDEANVDRFVGVLRDFLSSTQFIIVTHSKKTMAAANTLYGVTMEEPGVSKRVSVRFESTVAQAGSRGGPHAAKAA
ncbi:MAG: chromosome segregation protein SMC [Planctomycetia bacterium]